MGEGLTASLAPLSFAWGDTEKPCLPRLGSSRVLSSVAGRVCDSSLRDPAYLVLFLVFHSLACSTHLLASTRRHHKPPHPRPFTLSLPWSCDWLTLFLGPGSHFLWVFLPGYDPPFSHCPSTMGFHLPIGGKQSGHEGCPGDHEPRVLDGYHRQWPLWAEALAQLGWGGS